MPTDGDVRVYAQDQYGNTKVGKNVVITMSLGKHPEGGTLSGTPTEPMSNEKVPGSDKGLEQGVATFKSLTLPKAGHYSFVATSSGLGSVTSKNFAVSPGDLAKLKFLKQPNETMAGSELAQQPEIYSGLQCEYLHVRSEVSSGEEIYFDEELSDRESKRVWLFLPSFG